MMMTTERTADTAFGKHEHADTHSLTVCGGTTQTHMKLIPIPFFTT
jgi:C4-type Zn-finger protein